MPQTISKSYTVPLAIGSLAALAILCFLFTFGAKMLTLPGNIMSPIWVVNALMTSVFFRHAPRHWPGIAAVSFLANVAAEYLFDQPLNLILVFNLIDLFESLIAAVLLRKVLSQENPLSNLNDWFKLLVCGALLPALLGAALATAYMQPATDMAAKIFFNWSSSIILGSVAFLPVGLLIQRDDWSKPGNGRWLLEGILTLALTLAVSYLVFSYLPWPFIFVSILLIWSAIRLPRLMAFMLFFSTLMVLSSLIALGHMSVIAINPTMLNYSPKLPFLMLILPCSIIVMVMHAFKEEQKLIRQSENRFRNAMEYSGIGMALVSVEGRWMQVNKALCRLLGYSAEQLQTLTFQQITWPEDLRADLAQLKRLMKGEIESYSIEKRYYTHERKLVWAMLTVSMVRDSEGSPLYFIAQIEDINDLKNSAQINNRLMERITLATDAGGVGIWEWDLVTDTFNWDKRMRSLYELPDNVEPSYIVWLKSIVDEDRFEAERKIHDAINNGTNLSLEYRIKVKDGVRHIRALANKIFNQEGKITRMMGVNMDMTEVKQLNEALYQEKERLHITLDSIAEAVICTDIEMNIIFMNPVAETLSGWSHAQALNRPIEQVLQLTSGGSGTPIDNFFMEDGVHISAEEAVMHSRSGCSFDVQYSVTPLSMQEGKKLGLVIVIQDITESKNMLKQLSYNASHDVLTHLPNRFSFENRLRQLLQGAVEQRQRHALVFLDLDRFKAVNDSAGHAAGDALLREVSSMMLSTLRSGDLLARLGGDEFGLLLPNCSVENARYIAEAIVRNIHDYNFNWEGNQYRIGASCGVTKIDADNAQLAEVLSQADLACYASKNSGRGKVTIYTPKQDITLAGLTPITAKEQWDIIAQRPLTFLAQAMVATKGSEDAGIYFLSLLLTRTEHEIISEAAFRLNLTDPVLQHSLDRRVLQEFFPHYAPDIIAGNIGFVLPISATGLANKSFIEELQQAMTSSNMPPNLLHIAVSSEDMLHASSQMLDNLYQLHRAGSHLLLSQVNRAPEVLNEANRHLFDSVMLDPELIANIGDHVMSEMMVTIIHGHARRLKMPSIAGPVDTQVQFNTLTDIGVDLLFGDAIQPAQMLAERLRAACSPS